MSIVPQRPLGSQGLVTSAQGLGCMGMTAFYENKKRAAQFFAIAHRKGCTPAQLALAWLQSKGEDVFPIPGTKSSARIEENARAFSLVPLEEATVTEIETTVAPFLGDRNSVDALKTAYFHRL
eukprot:gene5413-3857_t